MPKSTVVLPFTTAVDIERAARFLSELVRAGLGFVAETTGESMQVTFTGAY